MSEKKTGRPAHELTETEETLRLEKERREFRENMDAGSASDRAKLAGLNAMLWSAYEAGALEVAVRRECSKEQARWSREATQSEKVYLADKLRELELRLDATESLETELEALPHDLGG